jgi:hypothetical protein
MVFLSVYPINQALAHGVPGRIPSNSGRSGMAQLLQVKRIESRYSANGSDGLGT